MILDFAIVDVHARRRVRLEEQPGEVEALGLPVLDHLALVEHLHLADHFGEGAESHLRHQLAHLFGDEEEEADDMLGLADEALAQHRVLGGHADRAGVEVAFAHHDAPRRDQRRGGEAEFVGTEERADDDVAAGADAAVDLHRDAPAQAVGDQRLMGFGESDLPRRAGVLDRGQGEAPVPPSKPAMVTWSARALETPAATVPTPTSETSFTDTRPSGLTFFRSKMSCARSSIE